MPAYAIQDFKSGLDLRKSYVTAPAGSLRILRNAFITSGAEIEKRTSFVAWNAAPASSFGVISLNTSVYVVENGPSAIASGTPGIISLPFPVSMTRIADWDVFNGAFYIVMAGSDGQYYHYFNQIRVLDTWTPPSGYVGSPPYANDLAGCSSIRTYGGKMYGVDGRILRFSKIGDPGSWNPPTAPAVNDGSGYIDLSSYDADSTVLVGLEVYYDQMAIFSNLSTQFWHLDPDPGQNQFKQLLRSTGLIATNGLSQFGNGDIMYLSSHGVRSLRVQNISLTAGTTDIGTPIDEVFRDLIISNGQPWFAHARCLIQPRSGRLFVILPDRIYVLSTFQEPSITAWSMFDAPFGFVDACVTDPWIVIRGDDNMLYLYGSDVVASYDATEAEVITPALACDSPSRTKMFHGFDVGAEGTWTLSVGCDPNNQATEETVATFTGATYAEPQMTMPEQSTHISLRFRTTDASRARLGHVMILFDDGSQD